MLSFPHWIVMLRLVIRLTLTSLVVYILCHLPQIPNAFRNITPAEGDVILEKLLGDAVADFGTVTPHKDSASYPELHFVGREFVKSLVCKNPENKDDCRPTAAAPDHRIYLSEEIDLRSVDGQSVLYHELIHVLQYLENGHAENCIDYVHRETEAYNLQYAWARSRGHDDPWIKNGVHKVLESFCYKNGKPRHQ